MKNIKILSLGLLMVVCAACSTAQKEDALAPSDKPVVKKEKPAKKVCHSTGSRVSRKNCIKAND